MSYENNRLEFIDAWGRLGSSWGINRTMAQIHALLLSTSKSLSTDDIMDELGVSRDSFIERDTEYNFDEKLNRIYLVSGDQDKYFDNYYLENKIISCS